MPHCLGKVTRTDKAHGEANGAERSARDDEIGDQQTRPQRARKTHHDALSL